MITILGVDYAWSHPGGGALKAAGKKFACRYLSGDTSKNLTRAEADDLAAHGVSCVVVWESSAKRPLSGRAAGIADAHDAVEQATAAGMPSGRPVYFAVDFDASAAQQSAINAYLDGAASVLGTARVGIYGGYYSVKRALDGGHAAWAWQTGAWSGGRWDPRAAIRQGAQTTIHSVSCDLNTATAADYGQWMPGKSPTPEDDMPLTEADVNKIWQHTAPSPTAAAGADPARSMETYTRYADARHAQVTAQIGSLTGLVTALTAAVTAGGGLTEAQATAAAEAGAKAALAQLGHALGS